MSGYDPNDTNSNALYHEKRRAELRNLSKNFSPSDDYLNRERQRFFANGGTIKKLTIHRNSQPNVWGDFIKNRVRNSG